MRLNLFLPARAARRRAGRLLAAALRVLGPSWRASPLRRLVQVAALAAFLAMLWASRPPGGAPGSGDALPPHGFLLLDPLVALWNALAGRVLLWTMLPAAAVVVLGLLLPRAFCGYLCPLGTLIDGADWLLGRPTARIHLRPSPGASRLRFYLLAGLVVSAALGGLLGGSLAAIALLTRGLAVTMSALQLGLREGWHGLPAMGAAELSALLLLALPLVLSVLGRRFWCRCLCPTGAVLSAVGPLRLAGRNVSDACLRCGACLKVCSFDAIRPDFTTRFDRCSSCQTCGGVCPAGAVAFSSSGRRPSPSPQPGSADGAVSRRELLAGAAFLAASAALPPILRARSPADAPAVRPPGSLPEVEFLRRCVRCGQCIRACPTGVLRPAGLDGGAAGLWAPTADCDRAGCLNACNRCGQVCPTGAIRSLPLEDKQAARMGLAAVDTRTCLPHAARGPCGLCILQCEQAGHHAIEARRVHVELDEDQMPVEDSGFLAPAVLPDRCVGCGQCQARCHAVNVRQEGRLARPAIAVQAGGDREDRIARGSYRDLRQARQQPAQPPASLPAGNEYVPDWLR